MDMKTLDYFIQAARTQSFSQAARDSHISQTAMSLAISKLENEIGYTLFDRDKRPMVLTPAGQEFFAWAAETAEGFAKITGAKPDCEKKPLFVIGAANGLDALSLSSCTRAFKRENPSVTIMTKLCSAYSIMERLASKEVDGCFVPSYIFEGDPDVRSIMVGIFPMMIVVSRDHELAALSRISTATLRGYTCAAVAYSNISLAENVMPRQMKSEGLKFKRIVPMEFAEEALMYAANNSAVAFLPAVVSEFLPKGFAALSLEGYNLSMPFAFCARKDNAKPELAAFQKFLERGEG